MLTYGFYHDCPSWSIGPSCVIKGSNTKEHVFCFVCVFFFPFYIAHSWIKNTSLSYACSVNSFTYFLAPHIARRSLYSRQGTEWQDSLLEKCHLMALVVQVMCPCWRTQSSDSYPWVISVCLKQLVLSLRHLSTCADDVLTGTLSPATFNQEKLRSCENCNVQLK